MEDFEWARLDFTGVDGVLDDDYWFNVDIEVDDGNRSVSPCKERNPKTAAAQRLRQVLCCGSGPSCCDPNGGYTASFNLRTLDDSGVNFGNLMPDGTYHGLATLARVIHCEHYRDAAQKYFGLRFAARFQHDLGNGIRATERIGQIKTPEILHEAGRKNFGRLACKVLYDGKDARIEDFDVELQMEMFQEGSTFRSSTGHEFFGFHACSQKDSGNDGFISSGPVIPGVYKICFAYVREEKLYKIAVRQGVHTPDDYLEMDLARPCMGIPPCNEIAWGLPRNTQTPCDL